MFPHCQPLSTQARWIQQMRRFWHKTGFQEGRKEEQDEFRRSINRRLFDKGMYPPVRRRWRTSVRRFSSSDREGNFSGILLQFWHSEKKKGWRCQCIVMYAMIRHQIINSCCVLEENYRNMVLVYFLFLEKPFGYSDSRQLSSWSLITSYHMGG